MIKRNGKQPSRNVLLFNGAGILIACVSLIYVGRSLLFTPQIEPCTERYDKATVLPLERDGRPITTADLQARVSGTDWNLAERARIVKLKDGPAKFALQYDVSQPKATAKASSSDENKPRDGVGFVWAPRSLKEPQSVCLAYSAFIPDNFDFASGGKLPGVLAIKPDTQPGDAGGTAIATMNSWRENGAPDIHAATAAFPQGRQVGADKQGYTFKRGLWNRLEQEIVLNDPGKNNGILRLWIDGAIVIDKIDMRFIDSAASIIGVLAEATAKARDVRAEVASAARTEESQQKIWLSPFELRWK